MNICRKAGSLLCRKKILEDTGSVGYKLLHEKCKQNPTISFVWCADITRISSSLKYITRITGLKMEENTMLQNNDG